MYSKKTDARGILPNTFRLLRKNYYYYFFILFIYLFIFFFIFLFFIFLDMFIDNHIK